MYPARFDYLAPESLDEALSILAERGDEVKILGGLCQLGHPGGPGCRAGRHRSRAHRLGHIAHREIDVSMVADLVRRRAAGELQGWPIPIDKPHIAIDPVCEMEVEVASAKWITDHDGETYYFCAPGCRAAFEKEPAQYAGV